MPLSSMVLMAFCSAWRFSCWKLPPLGLGPFGPPPLAGGARPPLDGGPGGPWGGWWLPGPMEGGPCCPWEGWDW